MMKISKKGMLECGLTWCFLHRSHLEVLTLGRGFLSDEFFFLLAGCESLQSLSITDATLGSGGAQEIQLRHESLCSLQIVKCRVLRIAIRLASFLSFEFEIVGPCSLFFIQATLSFGAGSELQTVGVRSMWKG